MPFANFFAFGTQEIGRMTGAGETTMTPVSKTTKDGVDVQLSVTFVDLYGGQDLLPADSKNERAELTLAASMVDSSLTAMVFALGLPTAALAGDLAAATPTQEVLSINAPQIGTAVGPIYALGPGPKSTRQIIVRRAQWQGVSGLGQKGNAHTTAQPTFRALTPTTGAAVTITDAV